MKREHLIKIEISGPVQTGKSATLESIKSMLEGAGYAVVHADPGRRLNPSETLKTAAHHDLPDRSKAVFVLVETTNT